MSEQLKEVRFDIFCRSCESLTSDISQDPCDECLNCPGRENSMQPLNYKQKLPRIFYILDSDQMQYTEDYKKSKNWVEERPTDIQLKNLFSKHDDGNYYENEED